MQTATAYIRVSTEGQVVEGVSLDAQRAKIQAWCELNDYTLGNIFVDAGISGSRADNRPELQKALTVCSSGGALIVYSLSRLARSTADTLSIADMLQKKGVDLVSLSERIDTTTAAGKMVFRMLAVLSEFERDQISERTTTAMQHKKSQGERVGSIPYGFTLSDDGVNLEPNKTEQKILSTVQKLRAEGLTFRAIADKLEKRGFKPRGKKWHPQTVSNIVKAAA
jgi:site-specific DNA recombinase